jgi:1,2-dihydroxy-3-keto-5-methylthiopentene dioxygenase
MSQLTIYQESSSQSPLYQTTEGKAIATVLEKVGVRFERWQTNKPITDNASNEEIIAAYKTEIERLIADTGYQTYDVISMYPEHPQKVELRQKFLDEHTHSDDEIRFFNRGKGMFTLHIDDKIYEVICEKNDLISVPAGTRHWFDMGENPSFTCIRLFDNQEGWIANFTGSTIAEKFSRLEVV